MLRGEGDRLPVSAMPVDGTWPTGTAKWEKRSIAAEIPVGPSICIDCGKCDRLPARGDPDQDLPRERARERAESFQSKKYNDRNLRDHKLTVQVAPDDCTGCGICVDVCPAKSKTEVKHKSINMEPAPEHQPRGERVNFDYFLGIPEVARDAVRRPTR